MMERNDRKRDDRPTLVVKNDDPPGPGGISCESCRHYADVPGGGECREDSPKGIMIPTDNMGGMAAIGFWPSTRKERWCGRHAPIRPQ
jgi:hypothetical protein